MRMTQGLGVLGQVSKAFKQLKPENTLNEAKRLFKFAIVGNSREEIDRMREFLVQGPDPSGQGLRMASMVLSEYLQPVTDAEMAVIRNSDIILASSGGQVGLDRSLSQLFVFDPDDAGSVVTAITQSERGTELRLPLARYLPAFRTETARLVIREVSTENAVFSITTALGDVVPSIMQPLIGVGEATGDMVVLTANQARMLLIIGAIFGMQIGYQEQWKEMSSVIGAGFGLRAIARNLVSKIPFGGGLLPKGAIAYAGTAIIGEGLIFLYTNNRRMTRQEARATFNRLYTEALDYLGKLPPVRSLLDRFRPAGSWGGTKPALGSGEGAGENTGAGDGEGDGTGDTTGAL